MKGTTVGRRPTFGVAVLLVCVAFASAIGIDVAAGHAGADEPETSGPVVTLERPSASVGEPLWIEASGFDAGWVTISFCGGGARRGSPDCNMVETAGSEVDPAAGSLVRQVTVAAPPVPCPCVVRVADRSNSQVALASIDLMGHPEQTSVDVSSLLEDASAEVTVAISAEPISTTAMSWLRSRLGGPAQYEVTVIVHNRSAVELRDLRLSGSAGRSPEVDLVTLPLDDPGALAPGQTWKQRVVAVAPPPSFDSIEWRVVLSGVGPSVSATQVTRQRPMLLVVALSIVLVLLGVVAARSRIRTRLRASLSRPV